MSDGQSDGSEDGGWEMSKHGIGAEEDQRVDEGGQATLWGVANLQRLDGGSGPWLA